MFFWCFGCCSFSSLIVGRFEIPTDGHVEPHTDLLNFELGHVNSGSLVALYSLEVVSVFLLGFISYS